MAAVLDTNLTSAFLCGEAAHPLLKRRGGKVINIGSMMSIFGAPHASAYGASKGGIVQFTRSLAAAWAADGIQANAVLPGSIDTELTQARANRCRGWTRGSWHARPRGAGRASLAGLAVFLASGASDFVTGAAIPVDGRYSIAW